MEDHKKVLITAGPTYEPIDPVRFIGNRSSGKMGYALAEAFIEKGAEVILVSGPVSLKRPDCRVIDVETAAQMFEVCKSEFPNCDITILAAAVADFAPLNVADKKIKKGHSDEMSIELKKTQDILAFLGKIKTANQILAGFSLETHNEIEFANAKLKLKNADIMFMNSLKDGPIFGEDQNTITVLSNNEKLFELGTGSKKVLAERIVDHILNYDIKH